MEGRALGNRCACVRRVVPRCGGAVMLVLGVGSVTARPTLF